jgi:hypothetical protein
VIEGADDLGVFDERKLSAMSTINTVLHAEEIAQLKMYHDSSLAASTWRAYRSDHSSFVEFLRTRFPKLPIETCRGSAR